MLVIVGSKATLHSQRRGNPSEGTIPRNWEKGSVRKKERLLWGYKDLQRGNASFSRDQIQLHLRRNGVSSALTSATNS